MLIKWVCCEKASAVGGSLRPPISSLYTYETSLLSSSLPCFFGLVPSFPSFISFQFQVTTGFLSALVTSFVWSIQRNLIELRLINVVRKTDTQALNWIATPTESPSVDCPLPLLEVFLYIYIIKTMKKVTQ